VDIPCGKEGMCQLYGVDHSLGRQNPLVSSGTRTKLGVEVRSDSDTGTTGTQSLDSTFSFLWFGISIGDVEGP